MIVVRAACVSFDTCPKRQSVTESSYNNSLADHHIWSTIKILPATLPEPKNRGPRSNRRHQNIKVLGPRGLERETLTGVTVGVSLSTFDFIEGGGLRMVELASPIAGLLDWFTD